MPTASQIGKGSTLWALEGQESGFSAGLSTSLAGTGAKGTFPLVTKDKMSIRLCDPRPSPLPLLLMPLKLLTHLKPLLNLASV